MTTPEEPPAEGPPPPPGYGPPPPGYGPPPPGYGAPQASNTPLVLGIIGIVLAFCCWPVGLALGIISYVQANKQPGGNPTIGMVAIGLNVLLGIIGILMIATGHGFVYYRNG